MQLHAHTHTDEAKHQSFIKKCQIQMSSVAGVKVNS